MVNPEDRGCRGMAGAVDSEVFAAMPEGEAEGWSEVRLELAPGRYGPSIKEPVKVSGFTGVRGKAPPSVPRTAI